MKIIFHAKAFLLLMKLRLLWRKRRCHILMLQRAAVIVLCIKVTTLRDSSWWW